MRRLLEHMLLRSCGVRLIAWLPTDWTMTADWSLDTSGPERVVNGNDRPAPLSIHDESGACPLSLALDLIDEHEARSGGFDLRAGRPCRRINIS